MSDADQRAAHGAVLRPEKSLTDAQRVEANAKKSLDIAIAHYASACRGTVEATAALEAAKKRAAAAL